MSQTVRKRVPPLPRHFEPPKKSKPPVEIPPVNRTFVQESFVWFFCAIGIFLFLALYSNFKAHSFLKGHDPRETLQMSLAITNSMGQVGQKVSDFLIIWLSYCSFIVALCPFLLALKLWRSGFPQIKKIFIGAFLATISSVVMVGSLAALATVLYGHNGGGKAGALLAKSINNYINEGGTCLVSIVVFFLSLAFCTGLKTTQILAYISRSFQLLKQTIVDALVELKEENEFLKDKDLSISHLVLNSIRFSFNIVCATLFAILIIYPKVLIGKIRNKWLAQQPSSFKKHMADNYKVVRVGHKLRLRFDPEKQTKNSKDLKWKLGNKKTAQQMELNLDQRVQISRQKKDKKDKKNLLGRLKNKNKHPKSIIKELNLAERYSLPPLNLLASGENEPSVAPTNEEIIENSHLLEQAFEDFKISGKITEVHPGPIVTLYQYKPAAGIKTKSIVSLSDDIARTLKVASVRIYAPVPGQDTVGIEIPNTNREVVYFRDVIDSNVWFDAKDYELKLALAKTTFGDPYVADLARMPHLLIAGATGTGKSVSLNSVLLSLLYQHTPETLRLILFDPKLVELSVYDGIAHLLTPVVTDPKRAKGVLWWALEEMERRLTLMQELGVRNLSSFNKAVRGEHVDLNSLETEPVLDDEVIELGDKNKIDPHDKLKESEKKKYEPLPWIVIVIDEFADLIMSVREIEEYIVKLAQKARATGIHLIIATQRPSVNVITGLIKANFPSRISFKVTSRTDARTVLDASGAEKLLGRGDMLFLPPGTAVVRRMHGPFVSDKEVLSVVRWLKTHNKPMYNSEIEEAINKITEINENSAGALSEGIELDIDGKPYDKLYDKVVAFTIAKGEISTSRLQAEFGIGYPKATKLMSTMEKEGIIEAAKGSKRRRVIVGMGSSVNSNNLDKDYDDGEESLL
ncbi:MAG: DNA translocase FtsK 4TM domain-containing protein [Deltaproteobacteria bacterium]|jgi:S-DNA-T family DNA segregation ATPase FtsK/SpoIIIE|nr:DNA translocase FtsK 4TM domain-containing protein [Deltaproteobacteria bacterium]